jgi:hypothetical protein
MQNAQLCASHSGDKLNYIWQSSNRLYAAVPIIQVDTPLKWVYTSSLSVWKQNAAASCEEVIVFGSEDGVKDRPSVI